MLNLDKIDWDKLYRGNENTKKQLQEIEITNDYNIIGCLMDELISDVNHQCDFYDSTMIVMSYLAECVKKRCSDLKYSLTIISYFSGFYCWEEDINVDDSIKQWYKESILYIRSHFSQLFENNYEQVIEFANNNVELSLGAFLMLLDTSSYGKDIARLLAFGNYEEVSIMCTNCEYEDETSSLDNICFEKLNISEKWDHKDFSNTSKWINSIYKDVENEAISWSMIITGMFTCPNCKKNKKL